MFLIDERLKEGVIKPLIDVLLCLIMFPINIRYTVSDNPFKLKYCHVRYKAQEMCNKVFDDFLPALKFDWFVTSKMIKRFLTALYADDNILF